MGLEIGIWASRLEFGPRDWELRGEGAEEEMKKEMKVQRSLLDKEQSRKVREKKEHEEEERIRRQTMLAAFEDERKQQEAKARSK